MSLIWWEKTVEYQFIAEAAAKGKIFAAPLDGGHERAGDTIFGIAQKWVLIEFKVRRDSLYTEAKKFDNYKDAKSKLKSLDSHHYLVFGREQIKDGLRCMSVVAFTYFSRKPSKNFDELLSSGKSHQEFLSYIAELVQLKKAPKGGKGASLIESDYMLVAGVNADNRFVASMTIEEFVRQSLSEAPKEAEAEISFESEIERPRYLG